MELKDNWIEEHEKEEEKRFCESGQPNIATIPEEYIKVLEEWRCEKKELKIIQIDEDGDIELNIEEYSPYGLYVYGCCFKED